MDIEMNAPAESGRDEICIECKNICKTFSLSMPFAQKARYLFGSGVSKEEYIKRALDNVSFTVKKGEVLGLIGMNGSGKTTLSRIIAGISTPTSGSVTVRGEVNMLSAGTGLNFYMTGMENIRYKCMLLGLNRKKTEELIPKVVEFSDLGKYIDQPLRTYSSGMRSRLGFSIAVFVLPDILIVDEALSAGDISFAGKCSKKIHEMRNSGRTIIFVSHSPSQMQELCDRILWINNGRLIADDVPERLILPYCAYAREYAVMTNDEREKDPDVAEYQKLYLRRSDMERNDK